MIGIAIAGDIAVQVRLTIVSIPVHDRAIARAQSEAPLPYPGEAQRNCAGPTLCIGLPFSSPSQSRAWRFGHNLSERSFPRIRPCGKSDSNAGANNASFVRAILPRPPNVTLLRLGLLIRQGIKHKCIKDKVQGSSM